jgi:hypothetical protein
MTVQSPQRQAMDFLTKPLYALGGAALLIALFTFVRVLASWQGDTEWAWMAILLPWLAIAIAAFVAMSVKPTLQLALTAGATTLAAYLGLQSFTWHIAPGDRWGLVLRGTRRDADTFFLGLTSFLEVLALIALMAATVWVIVAMKALLLGPASRASFGIDTTLLITAFTVLALANPGNEGGLGDLFGFAFFNQVLALSWVVPSVIVLALFVRQGGALAVGATIGLLAGTVIIPWITERIGDLANDRSDMFFIMQSRPEYFVSIPLAFLLVVTIWWALSRNVGGNPDLVTASSSSRINSTSIVAFSLAWLPLTSVPAVVLGHMAYDQIVDGDTPQRGLGLARWSIVFAYLSLFGGGFFVFNQLT